MGLLFKGFVDGTADRLTFRFPKVMSPLSPAAQNYATGYDFGYGFGPAVIILVVIWVALVLLKALGLF